MNPDQDRKNNVCPAHGPSSNKALMYSQRGILVFLGICFTWLIWNTTNAFPAVDDFCYGARANRDGILGSVASEYMSWGGRYTATLLISAFASSREILLNGYFLAPLAILAANFLAVSHFLNKTGIPTKATSSYSLPLQLQYSVFGKPFSGWRAALPTASAVPYFLY